MTSTQKLDNMTTKLLKVAERASRQSNARFISLAHLIDVPALARAYWRLRPQAAAGVDGVSKDKYGENLWDNLKDLHARLKSKQYRHAPIKRTYIEKADGRKRPLGISTIEDKLVQGTIREILEAIYEQDFKECSYGFRPGRNAHGAIRELYQAMYKGKANWILEVDIKSFFDSINHQMLMEMLQRRIGDNSLLRIISKCLRAGVLEQGTLVPSEEGTPQGSILSPILANVYLHYVLDEWFDEIVKPRMRGEACLIRYADDFVICFEKQEDAVRVKNVLHKRMAKYDLTVHPDKTRLLDFRRPLKNQTKGKGNHTFDFLSFTFLWRRSLKGHWVPGCKTSSKSLQKAKKAITDYCRGQRHKPVAIQHDGLARRLRGWFNYFGVNGNRQSMQLLRSHTERSWHKWLNRRSQRSRLTWDRFGDFLKAYPLPKADIRVQIW